MSKGKRWTKEEDKVLLESVKAAPHNLKQAFKQASSKLNRSATACTSRWYTELSKRKESENVAFMCVSAKKMSVNRKTLSEDNSPEAPSLWKRVMNFIKKLYGGN